MKSTPGPWHWHNPAPGAQWGHLGPDLIGADETVILSSSGYDADRLDISSESDARLIAAAPDMLTALQHLFELYGDKDKTESWSAWDYARAAIEKATGVKQ